MLPRLSIHLGSGIIAAIINATVGALILFVIVRLARGGGGRQGLEPALAATAATNAVQTAARLLDWTKGRLPIACNAPGKERSCGDSLLGKQSLHVHAKMQECLPGAGTADSLRDCKEEKGGEPEMPSLENLENGSALGPTSAAKTLSEVKEKSKVVAGEAVEKAADAALSAKAATSQFGAHLADTLVQGAETQKNASADAVATLARSARDAAENMQDSSPEVARLVRSSADAVERVSTDLRNQSLSDLIEAASNFAVRHPIAFFGCGVLAGFVAARLFSAPQR